MTDDQNLEVQSARVWEAKLAAPMDTPRVRVFANAPSTVSLQIRTRTGLSAQGRSGKPRNMIAHAELTREQLFELVDTINQVAASREWTR